MLETMIEGLVQLAVFGDDCYDATDTPPTVNGLPLDDVLGFYPVYVDV